jgi:aminoglycoside 3-N-acetyltransferase
MKKITKKIFKFLTGTPDPRSFFKQKKRVLQRKVYREKYDTLFFLKFIEDLGIKSGDTVFFSSSWDEFYNYSDDIKTLIESLKDFLGEKGNLVMPSNTSFFENGHTFDLQKTPTNAGLIAELFRRFPGVKRSIHLNSSVCIYGPKANFYIKDHEKSLTAWDTNSPYNKLYEENAKILTLGCGFFFSMGTPWHCVDSIMYKKNEKFKEIYDKRIKYRWKNKDEEGNGITLVRKLESKLSYINKYLTKVPHQNGKLSNLIGYSVDIKPLVNEGLNLAEKGISLYGKL